MSQANSNPNLPRWSIFACGSAASMIAETCTLPIDITKVRLQLQGEASKRSAIPSIERPQYRGMFHAASSIISQEGISSLYKGIRPALLRQCVYSGLRIGTYEPFRNYLTRNDPPGVTPLWKKILAGGSTGALASAIATPTDLVKVRLQAEGQLKPGEVPRYKGTFHAFYTIAKLEGVTGLWRGVIPTVQRAAVVNAAELATYDHFKQFLIVNKVVSGDNTFAHFGASLMAGFVATVFSNPVDMVKTRIMNQKVIDGKPVYRGVVDCFMKTIQNEGVLAMYKGFIPNYARLGPWCIIFFMSYEQLKLVVGSVVNK